VARYTAVLDACVLVPIALADTLLRVAERGLYRPLWSQRILGETADAILEIHPDLSSVAVARRLDAMNRSFEDALVEGWEDVEPPLALPDPDDRHVVATAIRGRADTIVTSNVRDYPEDVLEPLGIAAIDPDSFLLDQLDLAPRTVLEVIREQAAHTTRPSLTPTDLVARLARCGVSSFADDVSRMI
jgi:predicted nucleic acid-binding protein